MTFDFAFTPSRGPDRGACKREAAEAVEIASRGAYVAPSGRTVSIRDAVARAVLATREIAPAAPLPAPSPRGGGTHTRVVNGTSLASAREMASRGRRPLVLNFASAKNPGGGFLNGARAQEESLARASALYACIEGRPMYALHRASGDAMYTSTMIHSPGVPVFRDDETGALLEEPYAASFLTSAAPNAGVVLSRDPSRAAEVERVMRARVRRALEIAAAEGETHLVLGAWGCGVFRNDPEIVADAFARELAGDFSGVFDEIVFAVLDWSPERRFVRPFATRFAA